MSFLDSCLFLRFRWPATGGKRARHWKWPKNGWRNGRRPFFREGPQNGRKNGRANGQTGRKWPNFSCPAICPAIFSAISGASPKNGRRPFRQPFFGHFQCRARFPPVAGQRDRKFIWMGVWFFRWLSLLCCPCFESLYEEEKKVPQIESGVAPANQTKWRAKTREVHEFRPFLWILVFFLGKTSAIHIELWFQSAPGKSSWTGLSLVWFARVTPGGDPARVEPFFGALGRSAASRNTC